MRRIIFGVLAAVVLIAAGCGNLGEDPLPSPGPNSDGSVTLFVNGTLYNFDWTAQRDGIEIIDYQEAKPDGTGGSGFLNMGSKEGGGFAGSTGYISGTSEEAKSIYSQKGGKSMAFLNDLRNNYEGKWKFTLFDSPPLYVSDYTGVTFWAKWDANPETGSITICGVNLTVWTSSGIKIVDAQLTPIPLSQRNGQWYKYTISLNKWWAPGVPLPSGETIKQWQISVPQNAGRIYVDEIILK